MYYSTPGKKVSDSVTTVAATASTTPAEVLASPPAGSGIQPSAAAIRERHEEALNAHSPESVHQYNQEHKTS